MNGLEAVELKLSEAIEQNEYFRLDTNFFKKQTLEYLHLVKGHNHDILNNVVLITRGNTPKEYGDFETKVIRSGDLLYKWLNEEYLLKTKSSSDTFFLNKNDILISSIGFGSIGKVDLFYSDGRFATVSEVTVLRNSKINPFYLSEYLKSKFGQAFIEKGITGATGQLHLNKGGIKDLPVPIFSSKFNSLVEELIISFYNYIIKSQSLHFQAESLLLNELGLHNWQPTEANTEVKSFKNSFVKSGRLDAEYYQPKYDEIEDAIKNNSIYYRRIEEIKIFNTRGLQPIYFEDGDLDVINSKHILDKTLDYNNFEKTDSKYWSSQERARVFKNDILTYTTGANIGRTNVYLIDKKALASNHVNILRIKDENPIYVGFVMNSILGRLQTEKLSAGSAQQELYPKDIDNFLIPFIHKKAQDVICNSILKSLALQQQSQHFLQTAKQAVEKAIEASEEAAIKFINEELKQTV